MDAYLHTDREYFRDMDRQAAKDEFVERRQEELLDSLKHGDVKQVTRVCDSIDWDVGHKSLEAIAVLLANKKESDYTPVEAMFRSLIDGAINKVIEEENEEAKDLAFEEQYGSFA